MCIRDREVWAGSGAGQVLENASEKWITYGNTESGRGFIFYPGAKVEEEAYGPLMREIAEEGFFCVLVRMPGRLAVLGSGAAADVVAAYPEIGEWYLGGHSPVSYTHLDVYKRQGYGSGRAEQCNADL